MNVENLHIHFMGIGGIGVSALAAMASRAGAFVSGCDRVQNDSVLKLRAKSIPIWIGHDSGHLTGQDLLVYTSAIPEDHPERANAKCSVSRGAFLAEMMSDKQPCGVCGTHGKTTTSWLTTHILTVAGLDPSAYVGGNVSGLHGENYRIGNGPFVSELDESDGTFLLPSLSVAVLTNIESDHLHHYGSDSRLLAAFTQYAKGVSDSGVLVAGIDSDPVRDIAARHSGACLTFGFSMDADWRAEVTDIQPGATRFRLFVGGDDHGEMAVSMPGRHNVANALAAMAAASVYGVDLPLMKQALSNTGGIGRRMECLATVGNTPIYTDYAHHPTEVRAAIEAVRQNHSGPLLVVFQPHLYTRTRDYADDFGRSLSAADMVILVDLYPAREQPIPGVDTSLVARSINSEVAVAGPFPLDMVEQAVTDALDRAGVVVFMGAGDIDMLARGFVAEKGV